MKSRFLSFLLCLVALAGPPQARAVVVKTFPDLPAVTTLSDGDLLTAWSLADARKITFGNFKLLLPFQPIDADLTALAALTTTTYGRSLLTGSDANATRVILGLGSAALLNVGTTAGTAAAGDHSHAFSALSGIPTTLAGYGITDAASLTHTHAFSALTGKPTTLAGYGITDGLTLGSTSLTAAAGNHNHALSSLTGNLAVSQLGGGTGATATTFWRGDGTWATPAGTGGGTVNSVAITTANGISGTVANPTSTPAITLTLGAITPISIVSSGTISGSNLSGTNTGDQTITLTGDVTGTGTGSFVTAIGTGKVTLAMQANMATASLLGRNTAGSGAPEVLSPSTVKSLLAVNLVENTALSTWSGSTAINTLGTITAGTWNGTSIDLATRSTGLLPTASFPGGGFNGINQLVQLTGAGKLPALDGSLLTGLSSGFSNPMSAVGDIIYGGTAGTATRLAGPIANSLYLLTSQGTGTVATAPAFTALATAMSGYQTALTNSAGLLGALSDETGTGLAVFATSPTLVTPILGVATATSVNKITITAPATSATLTLAQGSSLITAGAFSNTLTTTAATNVTLPTTGTLATRAGSETFTNKILSTGTVISAATMTLGSDATGDIYYRAAGGLLTRLPVGTDGQVLTLATGLPSWATSAGGGGGVTTVSVVTANGISGSVATATTTPAITLTLGAITPSSVAATGALSGTTGTFSSGSVTGGSTGLTVNAGGTNQNIVLTPSGTGRTQLSTGQITLGAVSPSGVGFRNDGAAVTGTGTQITAVDGDSSHYALVGALSFLAGADGYGLSSGGAPTSQALRLAYNAAGVAEINNGSSGIYRDLIVRNLPATGAVTIGGGTPILKVLSTTATLDFPSTAAGTSSDLTVTVTGAAVGDIVALGVPNASVVSNTVYSGWVSAADTIKVRVLNAGSSAADPASGSFRVQVNQF